MHSIEWILVGVKTQFQNVFFKLSILLLLNFDFSFCTQLNAPTGKCCLKHNKNKNEKDNTTILYPLYIFLVVCSKANDNAGAKRSGST